MNSTGKQIRTIETHLYNIEAALDIAVSQKDRTELLRKQTKLIKKLSKLKRRIDNTNSSITQNDTDTDWR